ncbi:hypothetical protein [Amycolatopsis sp. NPDC059021]|uniref:hypothetical protein n=1 Tax=Amycolatopsis sp. NPDC059021 TaxID=3346704 RepID=UPI00366C481F
MRPDRRERAAVAPALTLRTELQCVGAYLYGYEDRITVVWTENVSIELPAMWCTYASIHTDVPDLLRITMRFVPGAAPLDVASRGSTDLCLLAPTHALHAAQSIVRRLNERGGWRPRARRTGAGVLLAGQSVIGDGGAVRDGHWVTFRPNPDTEELLASKGAGTDGGAGHEYHR